MLGEETSIFGPPEPDWDTLRNQMYQWELYREQRPMGLREAMTQGGEFTGIESPVHISEYITAATRTDRERIPAIQQTPPEVQVRFVVPTPPKVVPKPIPQVPRLYPVMQDSVGLQTFMMSPPNVAMKAVGVDGFIMNGDEIAFVVRENGARRIGGGRGTLSVVKSLTQGLWAYTGLRPYEDECGVKRMVVPIVPTRTTPPNWFMGVAWDRLFELLKPIFDPIDAYLDRRNFLTYAIADDKALTATALEIWLRDPQGVQIVDWLLGHPQDARNMLAMLLRRNGSNLFAVEGAGLGLGELSATSGYRVVRMPFAVRRRSTVQLPSGYVSINSEGWTGHGLNVGGGRGVCTGAAFDYVGRVDHPDTVNDEAGAYAPSTVGLAGVLGTAELFTWRPELAFKDVVRCQEMRQIAAELNRAEPAITDCRTLETAGNAGAIQCLHREGVWVREQVLPESGTGTPLLTSTRLYKAEPVGEWIVKKRVSVVQATVEGAWYDAEAADANAELTGSLLARLEVRP